MTTKKTSLGSSIGKTLIIIIGIVVALLLTMRYAPGLADLSLFGSSIPQLVTEVDPDSSTKFGKIVNAGIQLFEKLPSLGL